MCPKGWKLLGQAGEHLHSLEVLTHGLRALKMRRLLSAQRKNRQSMKRVWFNLLNLEHEKPPYKSTSWVKALRIFVFLLPGFLPLCILTQRGQNPGKMAKARGRENHTLLRTPARLWLCGQQTPTQGGEQLICEAGGFANCKIARHPTSRPAADSDLKWQEDILLPKSKQKGPWVLHSEEQTFPHCINLQWEAKIKSSTHIPRVLLGSHGTSDTCHTWQKHSRI